MKYTLKIRYLEASGCGERTRNKQLKYGYRVTVIEDIRYGRCPHRTNRMSRAPKLPKTHQIIFSSCVSCASWLNQKHHLLVPISVNSWFFQNFFSQNEPNPNESDVTANPYGRGGYNGFSQKIHQKNEPKQTQLNPILVRSFFRIQGLGKEHPEAYWCTLRTAPPPYNAVAGKRNR